MLQQKSVELFLDDVTKSATSSSSGPDFLANFDEDMELMVQPPEPQHIFKPWSKISMENDLNSETSERRKHNYYRALFNRAIGPEAYL
jgi:hypothetical protein